MAHTNTAHTTRPQSVLKPVPLSLEQAKALGDEVRVFILDLLSHKPMSIGEIAEELKKRGMFKNINTVRYHIQVLKEAGLIELVATEEVRGGVLKYYSSTHKVYSYQKPPDIEEKIEPLARSMEPVLVSLLEDLVREKREEIAEAARSLKPCPYCVTKHFAEYVILEAARLAMARAIQNTKIRRLLYQIEMEVHQKES